MPYSLNLERQIAAPPEVVFAAFLDPEAIAEWFKSPGDELLSMSMDARVGGSWEMAFRNGDSRYHHVASFTEIDQPRRLVFRMTHYWPDDEVFTTTLEVGFQPHEGGTRFTLDETFEDVRHRDILAGGWPELIEILAGVAEGRAGAGVGASAQASAPGS